MIARWRDCQEAVDDHFRRLVAADSGNELGVDLQFVDGELAQVLEQSSKIASNFNDQFVSTEHLFLAIFDAPGSAREVLNRFRLDKASVTRVLSELKQENISDAQEPKKPRAWTKYTRSLTKLASEKKLDPVVGRDNEINRVIQIISRRTKNNPILIGEAGVGKTAIVEGLAVAERHLDEKAAVVAPGLQHQHLVATRRGQALRHDTAGGARANDDEVGIVHDGSALTNAYSRPGPAWTESPPAGLRSSKRCHRFCRFSTRRISHRGTRRQLAPRT